jgi:uncharacterized membrane protein
MTVWRFDAPQDAARALPQLQRAVADGVAAVDDAALVSWAQGRRRPSFRTLGTLDGPGRLWDGFWGMLLGLVFLAPHAGPAFGAAAGAVAGTLSDFGVADDFLKRVRESVVPGTSALFLVSTRASADRLAGELGGGPAECIRSELSYEQELHLREALGEEPGLRAD